MAVKTAKTTKTESSPAAKVKRTPKVHEIVYVWEKSTAGTHIYAKPNDYDGAVKTGKQYLSVKDYPKAPKTIKVVITA